jgi:G3E family GTPase
MSEAIPVTVLTGFLGAGKTTLVNRLLRESHGRRIAVIVNEFGELGIDGAMITGATDGVIELANGCLCCMARGDLARALDELLAARAEVEAVLIETSGLADPIPVVADLERLRFVREVRVDGVITVIDADNFDRNLDNAEVAFQQITGGDILLINKVDLVESGIAALIETNVRRLNPHSRILATVGCEAPLDVLVGPARSRTPVPSASHSHNGFASVVLTLAEPVDADAFDQWLDALPATVFRVKGFVRLAGVAATCLVQCVGERRTLGAAPSGAEVSGAQLVVIGRELSAGELRKGLEACAA